MSISSIRRPVFSVASRFVAHLYIPLYRNGYALILSSALTSLLGVVYWILAAHRYPPEEVGLNSVAISAMMFLAGVAELNLMSALIRFIPNAGQTTRRLVGLAYLTSVLVALLVTAIFVVWLKLETSPLTSLNSIPYFTPWFIAATMAWCIFVLQDSVLTGLRQAVWVPLENGFFAVAKIVLLVILATVMSHAGVFASWTLALVITLLPTNLLIFRRLIPHHLRIGVSQAKPVVPRQLVKFVAADYIGSLFWLLSTTFLPVIVTQQVGATANAYFYLAWTIAYSLYLISPNMGSSLTVEAARDETKLGVYSFRVFRHTAQLVVPAVVVVLLGAPYLLWLFGVSYAVAGTTLLRLLALSAIPNIINALYISIARVQRHLTAMVGVLAGLCLLVLGLSYLLLPLYGITGVGLAWLVSQTIVAVILLLTRLPHIWLIRQEEKEETTPTVDKMLLAD